MPIKTKATKPKQPARALTLPEHMKLSQDEAALCARLIRVRRTRRYWLRYFIEHLLHMDATSPDDLSVPQAQDALTIMKNFENWQDWFQQSAKDVEVLKDFPGLEWYPWDEPEGPSELAAITKESFSQKEQLEAELRELRALIQSPRGPFRPEAAEYARRLGKTLDRMADENHQIDKNCGDE